MLLRIIGLVVVFISLPLCGQAQMRFGGKATQVKASGVEVNIYPEVAISGADAPLVLTGVGLREKKVTIFSVNVYIIASYIQRAASATSVIAGQKKISQESLESDLKSVIDSPARVLELVFLRDVDAAKIRNAFIETLKDNKVAVDEGSKAKALLSQINVDFKKGQKMVLIAQGPLTSQSLLIQLPDQTIQGTGPRLADDFWKIWFGHSQEGALKSLQLQLLGHAPFPS